MPSLIKFQPIHTALMADGTNVVAANQIHYQEKQIGLTQEIVQSYTGYQLVCKSDHNHVLELKNIA